MQRSRAGELWWGHWLQLVGMHPMPLWGRLHACDRHQAHADQCSEPSHLQGASKEDVGELALVVSLPACPELITTQVATILAITLCIAGRLWRLAGCTAVADEAGAARLRSSRLKGWQEDGGEEEVREVVGLHLHVVAVARGLVWQCHHPCSSSQ